MRMFSPVSLAWLLLSGCDTDGKPGTIDTAIASPDTGDARNDTATPTDTDCTGEAVEGDQDGDGIPDAVEEATDDLAPDTADSDGDGTCDGEEDTDQDGLSNREEVALGTALDQEDTDNDGMSDGDERSSGLDPLVADEDANGILDGADDFDGDGLTNAEEVSREDGPTDPKNADTDQDGYPDGYEDKQGSEPDNANDRPSLSAQLTCAAGSAQPTQDSHFTDLDGDGREDSFATDHYGSDYRSGESGYECRCTMTLEEGYARVVDLDVFTPTSVHNNSPWEDSTPQPIIGAIQVPFKTSTRADGAFLLSNIYQSKTSDLNGDSVLHWFAEPAGLISSSEVISIAGDYTVWISVKNPEGAIIEENDDDYSDGCARLSGEDTASGYEGYLRIGLSNTKLTTGSATASSARCTGSQQTHAMLAAGDNGRLRMLGINGSEHYTDNPITQLQVADWNDAAEVLVVSEGGATFALTPEHPSVTLPRPAWLHTVQVQADLQNGTTLPTVDLTHTCTTRLPPRLDGQRYPLSWRTLDTFLSSASNLLSVADALPSDAALDMPALNARIVAPPADQPGPTWLHIDARGGGPLMSIPLASDGQGGWTFDMRTPDFTVSGVLSRDSRGDLSVTIQDGSIGTLQLDEASFTVEAD